jgi:hypothetical protein
MRVYDLQCELDHRFEGWFASAEEFDRQVAVDLVACPFCNTRRVVRVPSAPRLNVGAVDHSSESDMQQGLPLKSSPRDSRGPSVPIDPPSGHHLEIIRRILASTENVGRRFAEEARRIHYGECEPRAIRGHTTTQEAAELREEGVEFVALMIPRELDESLQ